MKEAVRTKEIAENGRGNSVCPGNCCHFATTKAFTKENYKTQDEIK